MKLFFISLAALLLCPSCYVTTLTHSEAMDHVLGMTKEEVITGVGLPDAKQVEGEYEQWTYNRGQSATTYSRPVRTVSTASATPGSMDAYGNTNSVNVASSGISYGGGTRTQVYDKYVKLLFKDGVVVSWDTQGVDYSEQGPDTALTLAGVGATILGVILVVLFAQSGGV